MTNSPSVAPQVSQQPRDAESLEGVSETWGKARTRIFLIAAIVFLAFHLVVALLGIPAPLERRALHAGFGLGMVFLAIPTRGRGIGKTLAMLLDIAVLALLAVHCWYFIQFASEMYARAGLVKDVEVLLGIGVILVVIEATRRTIGWGLVALVLAALAYGFLGQFIPGQWGHGGFSINRLIGHMYLGFNGLFGAPTSASVEFIYLFLVLAALLSSMGASSTLSDIAISLFGRVRGGPAKVAVVASGLFGSISGSAAANTASSGGFTIPLMIRSGMHPRFAASVESVASVGGQFVPPVMGASAFIMAEFLNIPFSTIVIAAILPAVLYYVAAFIIVDFYAARTFIGGIATERVTAARGDVFKRMYLLTPLVVVIVCVAVLQYTPQRSAIIALVSCLVVGAFDPRVRRNIRKVISTAITEGAKVSLPVITAVTSSGIIIGMMSLTGLGTKLSSLLLAAAGDSLLLLLLLTMVASLILGAGLPTVPTYVLLATLVAPAMVEFGVHPIAAHMFIFYFGALADLTPPTAVSVVIASGIAKTNPLRTMFTATRVGAIGYLIPFLFIYHSTLLMLSVPTFEQVALAVTSIGACLIAGPAALEGWLRLPLSPLSRLGMGVATFIGVQPNWMLIAIAWLIILVVLLLTALAQPEGRPRWFQKAFKAKESSGLAV